MGIMAENGVDVAALQKAVNRAQEDVARQGDVVRGLKAELKDGRITRVSIPLKTTNFISISLSISVTAISDFHPNLQCRLK